MDSDKKFWIVVGIAFILFMAIVGFESVVIVHFVRKWW